MLRAPVAIKVALFPTRAAGERGFEEDVVPAYHTRIRDGRVEVSSRPHVYEALVHWGDVFLIATPIRWGAPSSLYFKMAQRMNCIQNQVTIAGKVLLQSKVLGAIITGGPTEPSSSTSGQAARCRQPRSSLNSESNAERRVTAAARS